MTIGNRSLRAVARAPFQLGHYRALAGLACRCYDPLDSALRYLTGGGDYPHCCRLRTPTGAVSPTLYSSHDMSTVNEVFCRQDYLARRDLRVAVDVGSNIGISALYFLTRNRTSRVYVFEPDPRNVARLHFNLRGYEPRFVLEEAAVGLDEGSALFGVEPTGRYGELLGHPGADEDWPGQVITVPVRSIEAVLERVLALESQIDILKIDTEGTEEDLVRAIPAHILKKISTIYYETNQPSPLHGDDYRFHYSCQTNRLTRRP